MDELSGMATSSTDTVVKTVVVYGLTKLTVSDSDTLPVVTNTTYVAERVWSIWEDDHKGTTEADGEVEMTFCWDKDDTITLKPVGRADRLRPSNRA